MVSFAGLTGLTVVALAATALAADDEADPVPVTGSTIVVDGETVVVRPLVFPVQGEHRFINDWHFPRDGGTRLHKGTDVVADRMTPLVAVTDGTIETIRHSNSGKAGNMVVLRDDEGWRYYYIHINNDTPGTDDGVNDPAYAFAPGLTEGQRVSAGDLLAWVGDSGNAESTIPHLHFGMKAPNGEYVNPYHSLVRADEVGLAGFDYLCRGSENSFWGVTAPIAGDDDAADGSSSDGSSGTDASDGGSGDTGDGTSGASGDSSSDLEDDSTPPDLDPYLQVDENDDGGGDETYRPSAIRPVLPGKPLPAPTAPTTTAPPDDGDDVVTASGGTAFDAVDAVITGAADIRALGDAGFRASLGDIELDGVVDIARTPTGRGFWLLDQWGDVQEFGDAEFHGALDDDESAGLAVAIEATPTGHGYWILEADGQVHPFGDAAPLGSIGAAYLDAPAADMSATPEGDGYVVVTESGTVLAMGDAVYAGSVHDIPGIGAVHPVLIQTTATGEGYWIL
ncbi:MAG: M23 family metallopeptidase, partial [Actinomyces sp.]